MPAVVRGGQDQLGNRPHIGRQRKHRHFHLRNACTRLGVRGRRAAVVAALRLGLLEFKA